jgi:osmotically-inducible protein OsmY
MDDKTLREEVMRALESTPKVNAAHIGVAVKDGAVTLSGHVQSYSEKLEAVKAAERVPGVRAVADELKVRLPTSSVRDDIDLAEEIAREFRWNTLIPDSVHAEVRNGVVTLRGEVDWPHQRDEARRVVEHLEGVTGINDMLKVKAKVDPSEIERRIRQAIERAASLDARQIWVVADNGTVHLHGHVHSAFEKELAERTAKVAPGVAEVDNQIVVTP